MRFLARPEQTSIMINKFQKLDDAICAHISQKLGHPTSSNALESVAREFTDDLIAWRLIDRRMQAMRKAGRLKYERASGFHGRIAGFPIEQEQT